MAEALADSKTEPDDINFMKPNGLWSKVVSSAMLLLLGFLISQITVIAEVHRNTDDILRVKESINAQATIIKEESARNEAMVNERVRNIVSMMTEQQRQQTALLDSVKELITLIKIQNQLSPKP